MMHHPKVFFFCFVCLGLGFFFFFLVFISFNFDLINVMHSPPKVLEE